MAQNPVMSIRRVVTGVNPEGTSVFVTDERVEAVAPALLAGVEFHQLWGEDGVPAAPQDGTRPAAHDFFPPAGGYRVGTFTVPPASTQLPEGIDIKAALAELEAALPGLLAHNEPENPGMHTTVTIDFEYVLSGRVVLELDDGATVELGPGDTVVQNGTRHAWRNPFDEPATLLVVLVGATAA
jgi:mannose-6-phosphate isomerase-like protein (cupin superfamily)